MSKYQLKMKTPSGLGTEYVYVESYRDNFERFLEEHNIKYKKYNYKTNQDKEIERLNNIINEIKNNCGDKTKDEVYLKMSKEALVNIINQKRNCIGYLRIERDKCFNIINELEKFLKINSEKDDYDLTEYNKGVNNAYNYTLDKLKELKEER